jgi:hypothetical protein
MYFKTIIASLTLDDNITHEMKIDVPCTQETPNDELIRRAGNILRQKLINITYKVA